MNLNMRWRVLIVLGAVALAGFLLWPSWQYYRLSDDELANMDPASAQEMKGEALRLGLDLQGGMHMVLELDDSELENPDLEASDLMDRALSIIRNRIDQYGVTEPVVQQAGDKRIIVELAGITDITRANDIIAKAAVLEFKMVRPGGEVRRLVETLDRELARVSGISSPEPDPLLDGAEGAEDAATDTATDLLGDAADAVTDAAGDAIGELADAAAGAADDAGLSEGEMLSYLSRDVAETNGRPLSSRIAFTPYGRSGLNEVPYVNESEFERTAAFLQFLEDSTNTMPRDVEFLWSAETFTTQTGVEVRHLYLLTKTPELTGDNLEDARPQPDSRSPGNFQVEFDLDRRGRRLFSRTTGENVGKLMAIVLDDRVQSSPEIEGKIRGGTATITGAFSAEEASGLAIVLRAGALPVPIRVEEQRAVGPSLGADSIELGRKAILIGFVGVLIFMLIYYRAAGAIATIALMLNLVFMLAALVTLDAVLTLPGIAGFVLTVGMAVDANVLIFERIREELRQGQTFRNAVNRGYDRAFRTIFDANLTTLFAALALLWFGTGPIKGFAVTLSVGIVVSMFTALFVTRVAFDLLTRGGGVRQLPV